MSLSRDSKLVRKVKAVLRARKSLEQRLDRIEWEEDVLIPTIEKILGGKSVLGLPEGFTFDIEVVHEDSAPTEAAGTDSEL